MKREDYISIHVSPKSDILGGCQSHNHNKVSSFIIIFLKISNCLSQAKFIFAELFNSTKVQPKESMKANTIFRSIYANQLHLF